MLRLRPSPRYLLLLGGVESSWIAQVRVARNGGFRLDHFVNGPPVQVDSAEAMARFAAFVADVRRRNGDWCRGRCIVGLPDANVLLRMVRVPSVAGLDRERLVRFEAQQNLSVPLDQLAWDCFVTADRGHELELLVAAMPKATAEQWVAALHALGFSAERLIPGAVALAAVVRASPACSTGGMLALFVGRERTVMVAAQGGSLWLRLCAAGSAELLEHDVAPDSGQTPPRRPPRLLSEVRQMMLYHQQRGGSAFTSIVAASEGSETERVLPVIGKHLQRDVQRLDAAGMMTLGVSAADAGRFPGAVTLLAGLALMSHTREQGMNLVPVAHRAEVGRRRRRRWWLAAGVVLTLSAVPPAWQSRRQAYAWEQQARLWRERFDARQLAQQRAAAERQRLAPVQAELGQIEELLRARDQWSRCFDDLQQRLRTASAEAWMERVQWVEAPVASVSPSSAVGEPGWARELATRRSVPSRPAEFRLAVTLVVLDRAFAGTLEPAEAFARGKAILDTLSASNFVSAVERERFDLNEPGLLRIETVLVLNLEAAR